MGFLYTSQYMVLFFSKLSNRKAQNHQAKIQYLDLISWYPQIKVNLEHR